MRNLTRGPDRGTIRYHTRPGSLVHARQLARMTGRKAASVLSGRRRCVVTAGRLYAWERGDDPAPRWAVESLALIYGVPLEAFYERNVPIRRKVSE